MLVTNSWLGAGELLSTTETTPKATKYNSWEFEITNMATHPIWIKIVDGWNFPETTFLPSTKIEARTNEKPGFLRLHDKKMPKAFSYLISIWNRHTAEPYATYEISPETHNAYVFWQNHALKAQKGSVTPSGLPIIPNGFSDDNIKTGKEDEDYEEDDNDENDSEGENH